MSVSKRAKIFNNLNELKKYLVKNKYYEFEIPLTICSGGFAPAHGNHIDYIQAASAIDLTSTLIVVVNGDDWLRRKKNFVFMEEEERAKIIASISGVDFVLIWDDGSPNINKVIQKLKPKYFAKGGDRNSAENVAEFDTCEKIGCEVVFGVGGTEKTQSSSQLIERIIEHQRKADE